MNNTYIRVHGAWHGGWAWQFVREQLCDQGHTVFAPNLSGHGAGSQALENMTIIWRTGYD